MSQEGNVEQAWILFHEVPCVEQDTFSYNIMLHDYFVKEELLMVVRLYMTCTILIDGLCKN